MLRTLLLGAAIPCSASASVQDSPDIRLPFVEGLARERASQPFRSPRVALPENLQPDRLDYAKYQRIGFRHDRALWLTEGLPFRLEFFHPGYLFPDPVRIREFSGAHVQEIHFLEHLFDYGGLDVGRIPSGLGYAGLKLSCELDPRRGFSELAAFLGSSYYRILGTDQTYGASSRALALDCGFAERREEFPLFTDWWVRKPGHGDRVLTLFGLLDAPSFTGAFEFAIHPGASSHADIVAVLFARNPENGGFPLPSARSVGLAPLTSMFAHGENSGRRLDDYRPEVHDSDGLLVHASTGEWIWRPLLNAAKPSRQTFAIPGLRGFGLLQRDRAFASYQDLFVEHERASSIWNEPTSDWGPGRVHLVELPAENDGADNIVAYWEPDSKPVPMQPFRYSYRQTWTLGELLPANAARVVATRCGLDKVDPAGREIVIDFADPAGSQSTRPPTAAAACSDNAVVTDVQVVRNPHVAAWRVVLKVHRKGPSSEQIDLRCALKSGADWISETWTYAWRPQ